MAVNIPLRAPPDPQRMKQLIERFPGIAGSTLVRFLEKHNGAVPDENIIESPDGRTLSVMQFVPVEEMPETSRTVDGFPQSVIPLAFDEGGNYFYVSPDNAVWFWDAEVADGEFQVAPGIDALLALMQPFDVQAVEVGPGVEVDDLDPDWKPEFD